MEQAQADQAHNEWQALGEGTATALAMHEPQLAEARAKLKAAEASLLQAQIKRSRCELRAPFAGRLQTKTSGLGPNHPGRRQARPSLFHLYCRNQIAVAGRSVGLSGFALGKYR